MCGRLGSRTSATPCVCVSMLIALIIYGNDNLLHNDVLLLQQRYCSNSKQQPNQQAQHPNNSIACRSVRVCEFDNGSERICIKLQ